MTAGPGVRMSLLANDPPTSGREAHDRGVRPDT
ncbi:hypothetical protein F4559_004730 [Saccharothrix violaceirubra]|uniref:Uncharacterized protein n=1 Tax=Saccharothrix violaceirubra TaxID=413306 RepID=A0A7W7T6A6_9PSEU|nr:hypothetical protein [Saccharothrix violaceirubra]